MTSLLAASGQILRRLLKWALALWFALLVLAFVLLGLGVALLSVLWSLLRGRKPAMVTVFQTFRQASQQFGRGARQMPGSAPPSASEVVDVEAYEVRPGLQHGNAPSRD
jgi:hypothetical protein